MEDNFIPSDYILGGFDYIGIEIELWNEKTSEKMGYYDRSWTVYTPE